MIKTSNKSCLNTLTSINILIPKLQGRATNLEIDFFLVISVLSEGARDTTDPLSIYLLLGKSVLYFRASEETYTEKCFFLLFF